MQIADLRMKLKEIYTDVRQISTEAKFSSYRQYSHNDVVQENNKYNLYMVVFESVFFLLICGAQVYYIKNYLENKRVI